MKIEGSEVDISELVVGDASTLCVLFCVEAATNTQPFVGGGSSDQVDDDGVAHQRFASPVLGDE